MTQQQPTGDWLELFTRRNPLKPTYAAMREEGVSEDAIETLWIAHEALDTPGTDPQAVVDFLRLSQLNYPVTVEDVWPQGDPNYDPTPVHQWQVTEGEGWSERNAAVMALVAGIESGEVA